MSHYLGERHQTRTIAVGSLLIGGDAPIIVQSMNNTDTCDIDGTLRQINALHEAGCDLTRLAVLNQHAAQALGEICARSPLPIVADIHFDYRLALEAIKQGVAKIRINPGNIGGMDRVKEVVLAAKERQIPIRVGVNSGSLHPDLIQKYGGVTPQALAESALEAAHCIETCGYDQMILSLKSSDPVMTIAAYREIAKQSDYPLHVGVTEAGTPQVGIIRSAVGIGTLLAEGIGDTIRVSLTGDPVLEVQAAKQILASLALRQSGPTLISCPTCGRTKVNLIEIAQAVETRLSKYQVPLKVAVMGCVVNGPGEAKDADIGIAGGVGQFVLFVKGERVATVREAEAIDALFQLIDEQVKKVGDQS